MDKLRTNDLAAAKLENQGEVEEYLRGLGLTVGAHTVSKVVSTLQNEVPLYRSYTRGTNERATCGKGTAYKIKGLYEEGRLMPFLDSNQAVEQALPEKPALLSGVVSGRGHEQSVDSGAFSMSGKPDRVFDGVGADAQDETDAARGGIDEGLADALPLIDRETRALPHRAEHGQPVNVRRQVLDDAGAAFAVDTAVGERRRDDGIEPPNRPSPRQRFPPLGR